MAVSLEHSKYKIQGLASLSSPDSNRDRFKDSKIQGFKNSKIQRFKDLRKYSVVFSFSVFSWQKIQGFKKSKIQRLASLSSPDSNRDRFKDSKNILWLSVFPRFSGS